MNRGARSIPTVYVRRLADGHECEINASDFSAALHVRIDAPAPPPPQPKIFEVIAVKAFPIISAADPDRLEELEAEERSSGAPRKGVMQFIQQRRAELMAQRAAAEDESHAAV